MKLFDAVATDLGDVPSAPKRRDDIDKVAREFESLLVNELFKVMRKTSEGSYLSNQLSENFQSMLDQEYANLASEGQGFGLADMLSVQTLSTRRLFWRASAARQISLLRTSQPRPRALR